MPWDNLGVETVFGGAGALEFSGKSTASCLITARANQRPCIHSETTATKG